MYQLIDQGLLAVSERLPNLIRQAKNRSNTYIEFTKNLRVNSLVIVDSQLQGQDYLTDIMKSLNTLLSCYYLQAASLMTVAGDTRILRTVDQLNPNRDPLTGAGNALASGLEGFENGLPDFKGLVAGVEKLSRENKVDDAIYAPRNLATGRIVEFELTVDGNTVPMLVHIGLSPAIVPHSVIPSNLAFNNEDESFGSRWLRHRSGELTLGEMLTCSDVIKKERKALINDRSGLYKGNMVRRNRGFLATVLTGDVSMFHASNMAVISVEAERGINRIIRGKLEEFRTREKIFRESQMMILAVVDEEYEMVTIYHATIQEPTELTFKQIKEANGKTSGNDLQDILKAYQLGNAPSF